MFSCHCWTNKEKNLVSFRMIMGFRDWSWFSSIIFQNSAINPEINYIVDSLNECNTNAVQSWTAICCQLKKGTPPGRLKDFRASSFFKIKACLWFFWKIAFISICPSPLLPGTLLFQAVNPPQCWSWWSRISDEDKVNQHKISLTVVFFRKIK